MFKFDISRIGADSDFRFPVLDRLDNNELLMYAVRFIYEGCNDVTVIM